MCRNPWVKPEDCPDEEKGEKVCRTEYESICETTQRKHDVDEDVVDCTVEKDEVCQDVTAGYITEKKCKSWPKNKCTVRTQTVSKYMPMTSCRKVPIELCAPKGCMFKQGAEVCVDEVKTIIQDTPSEECHLEPQTVCNFVTKMVPRLEPVEECVDVPKEICSRQRRNPRKVSKPMVKKWCYVPKEGNTAGTSGGR